RHTSDDPRIEPSLEGRPAVPSELPIETAELSDSSAEGSAIEPKPSSGDEVPPETSTGVVQSTVVGRRYEVVELLGSGRRGTVYLGRDRLTDARVAVKRLRTDAEMQQSAEYAMRAAELASTLRHPGIARVHDIGEDAVGPYIVSEYVDGPDLARVVTTGGAMELGAAISTVGQIGDALAAAHDAGLYHGAVRGSNAIRLEDGTIKLTDFGIAGLDETDEPRARRQDVRGLARTLCQLLTGVSQGTIDVQQLPWSVRPVIRHAMGRSVASRQSSIEVFLRELRATELDDGGATLDEEAIVKKGRQAELSGSFAAMREAGEQAQQANAESAEAMVLLKRADALEAEKAELIQTLSECETVFDYAGALEALSSLQRRFPADHHVLRLVGQKRQNLAELTRLRGLGDQLVAAGRLGDAVGPWQRVLVLRPDDPAAQEHVRLGRRARLRRRVVSTSAALVGLAVVGGTAFGVWRFTEPGTPDTNQVFQPGPVAGQPSSLEDTGGVMTEIPIVDQGSQDAASTGTSTEEDDANESVASTESALDAVAVANETEGEVGDGAESPVVTEAERVSALESRAAQAARDALSARGHALAAGGAGLATEEFNTAERRYDRGRSLLDSGAFGEAAEMLASARGGFVSAAGAARSEIASIESLIGERRLRAAAEAIDAVEGKAPDGVLDELRSAAESARGLTLRLRDGTAIKLRYVEPGAFEMGSAADEPGRRATEDQRVARIERPFWIMRTELTRGMLASARGVTNGQTPDVDMPVTGLSLETALDVAAELSAASDGTFSIPTESQWEYAARADEAGPRAGLDVDNAAWWLGNSGAQLRPVGQKAANRWGLVDTLGNAAELVIAPDLGHGEQVAMTRGGSYLSPTAAVRTAARHELVPRAQGDARTGVRLIWTPPNGVSPDTELNIVPGSGQ
ncbi:MAG: bifunctional serine/threonine-protein kinase/formylglycine-generating enzyme family protein, partial [Planctomycetota bacterium]